MKQELKITKLCYISTIKFKPIILGKGYIYNTLKDNGLKIFVEVIQYPRTDYIGLRVFQTSNIQFNWNKARKLVGFITFTQWFVEFTTPLIDIHPEHDVCTMSGIENFLASINFKF